MDFSGLVSLQVDELGRPTGLEAMSEGDQIASSVLTVNVRDAVSSIRGVSSTVFDSSAAWEAGMDADTRADLESVSGSVKDGSGGWDSTKTTVDAGSDDWGSVYTSVFDASTGWDAGGDPSATGFEGWNSTEESVTTTSSTWDTIYGDRTNIITTSARGEDVVATSGGWNSTKTTVDAGSANWDSAYNTDLFPSAIGYSDWDRVTTYVTDTSADLESVSGSVTDTSGNWNTIYGDRTNIITTSARGEDVVATSSTWDTIYGDRTNIITTSARGEDVVATSGGWNSTKTTVDNGATGWDNTKTTVDNGATGWDNTKTAVDASSAGWNHISGIVTDNSGTWETGGTLSGTASAIGVINDSGTPSSVTISGFESGDGTDNAVVDKARPEFNAELGRFILKRGPWIVNESGELVNDSGSTTINMANDTLTGGNNTIITRDLHVGNDLSAHVDANVQFDPSTITVSSCPVPPPFAYVQTNTTLNAVTTSDKYYFASGIAVTGLSIVEKDPAHITWDTTNHYFTIANPGYYQFEMGGSFTVALSPTTVTIKIMETTGLGGTESDKNTLEQVIRTNMDPHTGSIRWIGYLGTGGVNYTCSIQGNNNNTLQIGSSFSCKRIG